MLWLQAVAWADRADVIYRQLRARCNVANCVDGTPEGQVRLRGSLVAFVNFSQRFPCCFTVSHKRSKFRRLQRKCSVGTTVRAPQREVLFDDTRSKRYRR